MSKKKIDGTWRAVLQALEAQGWKVGRRAGRQAYYTTPTGRRGTLSLNEYAVGVPRWTVDKLSVRIAGKLECVTPEPPADRPGGHEFSCSEDELETLAPWFPAWLFAYEAGAEWPACPVPLAPANGKEGDLYASGYRWTKGGKAIQERRDKMRGGGA